MRVPKRFFRILDFPYLKLWIRDFKAKRGTKFGFEVVRGMWVAKNKLTIRITGLNEFWSGLREWRTLLGNLNYICLQNFNQLHSVWTNLIQLTATLSRIAQIPCSVIHIKIYYISVKHVIFQFSLWYSNNERFCKAL